MARMTEDERQAYADERMAEWAADPDYVSVARQEPGRKRTKMDPGVGLWLRDGRDIPCLVAAEDDLGNWTVLTDEPTPRVVQYLGDEVE